MSVKSLSIVAAATLALCSVAAQAATTNAFANGGFEDSTGSLPADSWLKAAAGYSRSTDAHSGSYSAQLSSPALNAAVMLQNNVKDGGMPALVAGDDPVFSFWAKGFAGTTGNVLFALRYLDTDGNILADSLNVFFQGSINTSSWTQITYDLGAVPVGASAAFVEFSQAIGPIGGDMLPGKVLIDDVYLGVAAPVPEPETYAMMLVGLVGVGALVRRRRSA